MTQARDLADGKFDTDTLVVDAANDRVGMGTTSPYGVSNFMNLTLKGKNASSGGLIRSETSDASITSRIYTDSNGLTLECDTDDNVLFRTNGSERGRWLSGGGLTFNGDTAAANALDDYEEGTFTANFDFSTSASGGMTWANQSGRYIKIGSQVFISAFLSWTANGFTASSGSLRVVGLPFAAANTNAYRGGFYMAYGSNPFSSLSGAYGGFFRTETNLDQATFNYPANTDTLNYGEVTTHTKIGASGNFMITGSYTVI